jgi:hypothetical protein
MVCFSRRRWQLADRVLRQWPATPEARRLAVLVDEPEGVGAPTLPGNAYCRLKSPPDLEPPRLGLLVVVWRAVAHTPVVSVAAALTTTVDRVAVLAEDRGPTEGASALSHGKRLGAAQDSVVLASGGKIGVRPADLLEHPIAGAYEV